jgi:hypothetical protein
MNTYAIVYHDLSENSGSFYTAIVKAVNGQTAIEILAKSIPLVAIIKVALI